MFTKFNIMSQKAALRSRLPLSMYAYESNVSNGGTWYSRFLLPALMCIWLHVSHLIVLYIGPFILSIRENNAMTLYASTISKNPKCRGKTFTANSCPLHRQRRYRLNLEFWVCAVGHLIILIARRTILVSLFTELQDDRTCSIIQQCVGSVQKSFQI